MYRLLVINPGSSSRKTALYEDAEEVYRAGIVHDPSEFCQYKQIFDQHELRRDAVKRTLDKLRIAPGNLSCVVGRCGILRSVPSGACRVNQPMLDYLRTTTRQHAANLVPVIAHDIAQRGHIPAFIVDPISLVAKETD